MTYAPTRARVLLAPPDAPAGGSCAALLAVTPGSRVRDTTHDHRVVASPQLGSLVQPERTPEQLSPVRGTM